MTGLVEVRISKTLFDAGFLVTAPYSLATATLFSYLCARVVCNLPYLYTVINTLTILGLTGFDSGFRVLR